MSYHIIPLFPLGVVLFPMTPLPLHIFEERYKLMIGECLEKLREFGVVLYSGDELQNTGCTAKITKLLKQHSDGRMDILTEGVGRFVIHEVYDKKPYLEAKVSFFDDDHETETEDIRQLAEKGIELLKLLKTFTKDERVDPHNIPSDPKRISYLIAGTSGFTVEEMQTFLEMRSSHERLRKGVASLEKNIERIELSKEIMKIINGNGNIPQSLQKHIEDR